MSARRKVTDEDRQNARRQALSLLSIDRVDELVTDGAVRTTMGRHARSAIPAVSGHNGRY